MTATLTKKPATRAGVGQTFKFFTGAVKAYKLASADGKSEDLIIEGIASSNTRDRMGDTMSAQCQTSMLAQAKGLTMFGNHEYDVPENVFGKCTSSKLEVEGDVIKLAIVMTIAQSNPRAVKSWELIAKDGVRLAFSVGGRILEAEVDEENDDGSSWWPPLLINLLELLEVSLVGIPANPEAYTRSFLEDIKKSAFKAATRDPGVQKAFLRSIGVKSVEDDYPDLGEGTLATLEGGGVTLYSDEQPADGSKVAVNCSHDPACESFDAHVAKCVHKDGCAEPHIDGSLFCESHKPNIKDLTLDISLEIAETTKAECERIIAEAKAAVENAQTELSAINTQISAKQTEKVEIEKAVTDLTAQVEALKATPAGRTTKTTPGGSSLTTKPLSEMTADELREYARKRFGGGEPATADARTFGATEGVEPPAAT